MATPVKVRGGCTALSFAGKLSDRSQSYAGGGGARITW